MITPQYLNYIMDGVEEKLSDVQDWLLQRIAKRIVQTFSNDEGDELLIQATKHDIRKLMYAGMLYDDIQTEIEHMLPDMEKHVRYAFYDAAAEIATQNAEIARAIIAIEGFNINVPEFKSAGITFDAANLEMTKAEIRQLEAAYRRTKGEMRNLTQTCARNTHTTFINACDSAYMKVKTGVSVQSAVVDAIKKASDAGVECVTYGGKKDRIEVAIARAVRTGVNQANGEIVLTRCAEMGVSYVKTSAHLGARVTDADDYTNHSWWQGRVFSVDWSNPHMQDFMDEVADEKGFEWLTELRNAMQEKPKAEYPDFVESCGYGDIRGCGGANCRHSVYPFYPGIQLDDDSRPDLEENKKRYDLDQKQRRMERAIRKTKRELAGLKAAGVDTEEFKAAKKQIREKLTKQTDQYMDFCKANGLKPRNMSLKV